MRTAAVLDLGTNTFKLGIYRLQEDNAFERLEEQEQFVKLGLKKIGEVTPDAWDRGMETLARYDQQIKQAKAEIVLVAGTEALRKAENGAAFLEEVKDRFGITVQIISGEEEARLTLLGAQVGLTDWDQYALMDIGGGSTEVVLMPGQKAKSFPLGAAALHNALQPSDPFKADEIQWIGKKAQAEMGPWLSGNKSREPYLLAGTSGSFESIAEMLYYPFNFEHLPASKLFLEVNAKEVSELQGMLASAPLEERLHWPGLNPERAEYIVPAITLVRWMMETLQSPTLRVVKYGLKEGLLLDRLSGT